VTLRHEGERESGYNARTLLSHFWRMVLTSGTRSLRVLSLVGAISALLGFLLAFWLIVDRILTDTLPAGWTSLMVITLFGIGVVLLFLGVIAEYLGVAVNMAMGKPLYLITGDPASGPLGRQRSYDNAD
jgi:undecaprenyl-phosphate 4-deoxy-4-formamido-L-arabinose transferase